MGTKERKSRMGRPPKRPEERLTSRVTVSMKAAERRVIDRAAKAAKMSLSEYLLRCWREARRA